MLGSFRKVSDATTLMVNVFDETVVDAVLKAGVGVALVMALEPMGRAYGDIYVMRYVM